MRTRRALAVSLAAGFAALCLGAWSAPARAIAGEAPGSSFLQNFSGMVLLDQDGRSLRLDALQGKVVVFNFVFTGCSSVCPVQTQALARLQRQMAPNLRSGVHWVSVSLDPLSDTPATLKSYARNFEADFRQWSFATGRPEDIHRLAEALWLFRDGKGTAPLEEHNSSLWLIGADGSLRMRLAGSPLDAARLERELAEMTRIAAPPQLPATVLEPRHTAPSDKPRRP